MIVLIIFYFKQSYSQTIDISFSPYQSIANYYKPRGNAETPMGANETYFNSGIYLKAYEGSFIEMLFFDTKRFSIGEYLRLGAGLGAIYSPEFKHLKDDGSYTLGFGGVNGNNELIAYGPVDKTNFGYLVELNYGLQARYKFDPENSPNKSIGFRWYYSLAMNPIFHVRDLAIPNGHFLSGTKSIYYTDSQFSAILDWDARRKTSNQTHDYYFSLTLKKYKEEKSTYRGIRIDYIQAKNNPNNYNSTAYSVNGFNLHVVFGRSIF